MSLLDKLVQTRLGATKSLPPDARDSTVPTVVEFLTRVDLGGGVTKEPASITVRLSLGEWAVEISDPGLEVSIPATSDTLLGVFEALERVLTSPNPPIKTWRGATGNLKLPKKEKNV